LPASNDHDEAVPVFLTRSVRLALIAALAVGMSAPAARSAQAPAAPWRVVILMTTDPALPAMQQHDRALRATLRAAAPGGVTFFTDTLDAFRFDYRDVAPEFLALQRKKYAGQPVDLVVGVGEQAVDALRDQRDTLWAGVPIVIGGLDEATLDRARLPAGTAQAAWRLDIAGTLALIESLQPRAERLIVVGGAADGDRALVERVATLSQSRGRWPTERWTSFSIEQLRDRLGALDSGTAVVFTTMSRDANGRTSFPGEALADLAAASGAPIYGLYGTYIGRGAAAGSVVDFEASGRRAAELGIRMLRGEPAPGPAESLATPVRCTADHVQLRRHGLEARALPPGCELMNPPRSLWTEYRGFVLAAAAVVALQALTIGGLLLQRRRRRLAELDSGQRRLELARAMRFAAMGELTASIAHEINQPLGAILSNADAAALQLRLGTATAEGLREILADIRRDDLRATEVIRRLRALLEKHEVEHAGMVLHPALRDALALIEPEGRRRGVTIEATLGAADDRLVGDPVQLQQVLLNLAINAMDAMDATPQAARHLSVTTTDAGDRIAITVADRGVGIPAAMREKVFESFHTTKPHGMGLGLPIVRAIVDAHDGQIAIDARAGGGTLVTVTLPRRAADAQAAAAHFAALVPNP
jgi:signal transduction histidine kinase